eukprot:TRINITY_DN19956_c0_g2_i1.p1 TRINITY_DN19956_c0_g2~~TRINITY_DN19956_c0_g2_i1.p1  ORF type:complete len:139 (+),score=18.79 TRINITY_DN19956_c0_g2_i1:41-457(+)
MAARPSWEGAERPWKTRVLLKAVGWALDGGESHPLYGVAERVLRPETPAALAATTVQQTVVVQQAQPLPLSASHIHAASISQSALYVLLFYAADRLATEILLQLRVETPTSRTAARLISTAFVFNTSRNVLAGLNRAP